MVHGMLQMLSPIPKSPARIDVSMSHRTGQALHPQIKAVVKLETLNVMEKNYMFDNRW
jgi:hypothetical protein